MSLVHVLDDGEPWVRRRRAFVDPFAPERSRNEVRMFRRKQVVTLVVILMILSGATVLVASDIPEKKGSKKTAPAKKEVPRSTSRALEGDEEKAAIKAMQDHWNQPPGMLPANVVASYIEHKVQAKVNGNRVRVLAELELGDKRPNRQLVWSLVIYDAHHELPEAQRVTFFAKDYVDAPFQAPQNVQKIRPTFAEEVELQPGSYVVEVILFSVAADYDLTTLRANSRHSQPTAYSSIRYVTIK